jgi:hypothetical protein
LIWEDHQNLTIKRQRKEKMELQKLMESGFFYRIGVNAQFIVVEEKVTNKECANLLKMEEHLVLEMQYLKKHVILNHVPL